MTRLTLLLAFVAAVLSYDNGEATVRAVVRLGGITISYNPAHWRHGDTENPPILAAGKTKGESLRYFVCIAPECRGDPFVWASARLCGRLRSGRSANRARTPGTPEVALGRPPLRWPGFRRAHFDRTHPIERLPRADAYRALRRRFERSLRIQLRDRGESRLQRCRGGAGRDVPRTAGGHLGRREGASIAPPL